MSLNALTAAHKVLVPLELHIMGVQGLAQLMNTITTVKDRLNPSLEIDGILACRTNKRTRLAQDILLICENGLADRCTKQQLGRA